MKLTGSWPLLSMCVMLFSCGTGNKNQEDSTAKKQTSKEEKQQLSSIKKGQVPEDDLTKGPLRRLNINDTLSLELRRPLITFIMCSEDEGEEGKSKVDTLWSVAALRGKRGYYQVLDPNGSTLFTSYNAFVSAQGDVVRLGNWVDFEGKNEGTKPKMSKPISACHEDFGFITWDVKYKTQTGYLSSDLDWMNTKLETFDFAEEERGGAYDEGGEEWDVAAYHLLPIWIAQEQEQLKRTQRLPKQERLDAYIQLSQDTATIGGRLSRPYRPLLVGLLKNFQSYPLPEESRNQLNKALETLRD